MSKHSLNLLVLERSTYCHRSVMVMLATDDGTFDGCLALRELHKTVVVSYCYSAFDRGQPEPLLQLNKPAKLNDVKRTRVSHPNVLAKRRKL